MSDEKAPEETPAPAPGWEHRQELGIQKHMREVIKLTIEASEKELSALQRKVRRLTYGS
jgi:hypothetical protein